MDPLSVTASILTLFQGVSSSYEGIRNLRGLPHEFDEVNRNLGVVQATLEVASEQLDRLHLDDGARDAIYRLLLPCQDKAKMLQNIFLQVEKKAGKAKQGSVIDTYRSCLLRLGKAHRVESLMHDCMRGLEAVATHRIFATATHGQIIELQEAIERLADIQSSVSDSALANSGIQFGDINQTVHQGGEGRQFFSNGDQINGNQYNSGGGAMNFVPLDDDRKSRNDILRSLYTSKYLERKNRNPDRVPGTCNWFIGHSDFRRWRKARSSGMLWVSANPGCGKSVLAKHLVDVLSKSGSRTTCYFFFKDDFEDQKSATGALSCILHQLFTQREDLFSSKIIKRFESRSLHLSNSFDELWDMLLMTSSQDNTGEIVCILDALDECEDKARVKLTQALRRFYDSESRAKNDTNLKFLITSRPYDRVGRGFQPLDIPGVSIIHLKGEEGDAAQKIGREIDFYIQDRVSLMRSRLGLEEDEESLLLKKLGEVENQTYLWVYLTLEFIEEVIDHEKVDVKGIFSTLPASVEEAYERILNKSSNLQKARKLLHIIVGAARPLTVEEIQVAMLIREHHTSFVDLRSRSKEPFTRYIRDLCGLFVNIIDSKVYLLHQTAKEFLVAEESLTAPLAHAQNQDRRTAWKSSLRISDSHRILGRSCICLLLLADFDSHDMINTQLPLFHYSATYWSLHFRASGVEDGVLLGQLRQLCDSSSVRCQTWFSLYWRTTHEEGAKGFTTLMIASYFGLTQVVEVILREQSNFVKTYSSIVNATDDTHRRSALSWASEHGFDDIVKLLLKRPKIRLEHFISLSFPRGTEVDAEDAYGRTPLSYAAWNGHAKVIKQLIKAGASPHYEDTMSKSPISYALANGQGAVIKLLGQNATPDDVQKARDVLLVSACEVGNGSIVQKLIDDGASIESRDHRLRGVRRPLTAAAGGGHLAICELLLQNGAAVDSPLGTFPTPLAEAARAGHESVCRLLLQHGAAIEAQNRFEETPLILAASAGHKSTCKILLQHGAMIEAQNYDGRTPLILAASAGYTAICELLLQHGAAIEAQNNLEETSLMLAAYAGHTATCELLLQHGAMIEAREANLRTPLMQAAYAGHRNICELLLQHGVALEARDNRDYTPFILAVTRNHEDVYQLLLEVGANVNALTSDNQTALDLAYWSRPRKKLQEHGAKHGSALT